MSLEQPDIKELRAITEWVSLNEDVREISLAFGDVRLFISRDRSQPAAAAPAAAAPAAPAPATINAAVPEPAGAPAAEPVSHGPTGSSDLAAGEEVVTAPMVGTFYSAPKPGDPVFVQVGDSVEAGSTLGIVEVMKLMNTVEAAFAGTVTKILVKNEQTVEYGQPLLVIKRHG